MKSKIFFIQLFFILFASCASKKSSSVQSTYLHSDSSFTHAVDTSAVSAEKESQLNITEAKTETTATRTTEYNDSGTVIRIIETIVLTDYQRADLSQIFERTDALSGISTITITGTGTQSDSTAIIEQHSDTRPIQGREWLWLPIGIVLAFVLYKLLRKYLF